MSEMNEKLNNEQLDQVTGGNDGMGEVSVIDIYPMWQDKAILEVELSNELTPIDIPPEITVVKEVTNDLSYRNVNLASL